MCDVRAVGTYEASLRSVTVNPSFFQIPCKSRAGLHSTRLCGCIPQHRTRKSVSYGRGLGEVHQVAVPVALNNEGPERPVGV